MHPLVDLHGVSFAYPGQPAALCGLELQIAPGEVVALAGASGSGKSTLCRLLTGLIPHLYSGDLRGRIRVAGRDVTTTPPAALSGHVALVLQDPAAQCVASTVARDIALGPAYQGLDRDVIAHRVQRAACELDITHLLDRSPHELSGGEQQRVVLAGSLAQGGQLLVLDEPFAFLDQPGAVALQAVLMRLRASGVALVVADHRLDVVLPVADRLVVLHHGRVVWDGAVDGITPATAAGWGLELPGQVAAAPRRPTSNRDDGTEIVAWEDVWFSRPQRPVLRGASLRLWRGEVLALLGPNGAGKSTLLRHANGLLRPQRGLVRVAGRAAGRRPVADLARDVGLVWQQPLQMLFKPTVREEIAAGPRALGRDDQAWRDRLCEQFAIGPLLDRVPQRLSAGERRRVAIVAVLASRPQALLLDEPTAGQDATARRTLVDIVVGTAAGGAAVAIASHDSRWVGQVADRIVHLDDGRVEQAAP